MTSFEISCFPWVSLTSTRHGGGDWQWRLMGEGEILASGRGYTSQKECAAAVQVLRKHAATAELTDCTSAD